MGRVTLYSRSRRAQPGEKRAQASPAERVADPGAREEGEIAPGESGLRRGGTGVMRRLQKPLLVSAGAAAAVTLFLTHSALKPVAPKLTQADIDAAVLHTLETKALPSAVAHAYDVIRPSVVRVRQLAGTADGEQDIERSVGTGVVIVDKGIILTNLHVVAGGDRLGVIFADGTESEATVIGVQPENDLAVIQAKTLPDDLMPATLRPTTRSSPSAIHSGSVPARPRGSYPACSACTALAMERAIWSTSFS